MVKKGLQTCVVVVGAFFARVLLRKLGSGRTDVTGRTDFRVDSDVDAVVSLLTHFARCHAFERCVKPGSARGGEGGIFWALVPSETATTISRESHTHFRICDVYTGSAVMSRCARSCGFR